MRLAAKAMPHGLDSSHKNIQGGSLVNPITVSLVYAVIGTVVVSGVLSVFKSPFRFADVALACVGAAVASLIPTVGGPVSLLVMLGLLHWRCEAPMMPDVAVAVLIARLAMVPALLLVA